MPRPTRKRYRNVTSAVFNTPWAILPEKLQEIAEIIDLRSNGMEFTPEEIRARVGTFDRPQDARHASNRAGKVAVLNLFGTVTHRANMIQEFSGGTSTEIFKQHFGALVDDDNVSAIVINIDSPGGTVPGVPELSDQIYAARGTKPIIAVANPLMASAVYWIGSAADEIVAIPSAWAIGSIGVLNMHSETSQMDEKLGIRNTVIRSVPNKATVNGIEPLSEEARATLQTTVDSIHADFVAAVARNRGISVADVNEQYGQGNTFRAAEALKRGLIDRIDTFENVLAELGVSPGSTQSTRVAANTTRPILSLESANMDPRILTQLVRMDLIEIGDNEQLANVALNAFCKSRNVDPSADVETLLAALKSGYITTPAPTGTATAPSATTPVATAPATVPTPAPPTAPAARQDGMGIPDIVAAIRMANLPAETALELQGELVAQAGSLNVSQVLDRINASAQSTNPTAGHTRIDHVADAVDKFQTAARDALLTRAWNGKNPDQIWDQQQDGFVPWSPQDKRNYGLNSLMKLAEASLRVSGVTETQLNRLSQAQIAQAVMGKPLRDFGIMASDGAYNTSGMFANILYDAANVMLRRSYTEVNTTFQEWSRQGESLKDFKPVHKVIAGELSDPKAIPEDGEFEETTISDGRESYKLTVWGERFSITWETLVNDQLSAFTEIPMKQGRAMRRKQNKLVYGVLKDNATLSDSVALFSDATHNNLTTGSATPTVGTLNAMMVKMATQTGLNSDATLNLTPKYILSSWALWGTILELLGSTANPAAGGSAAGSSGVKNIWQNALTPITDAELGAAQGGSDTAWHLVADSGDIDTVEYAYLQGLETPAMDKQISFDRLGVAFRVYQAFATKALDFRGMQKHNGA